MEEYKSIEEQIESLKRQKQILEDLSGTTDIPEEEIEKNVEIINKLQEEIEALEEKLNNN